MQKTCGECENFLETNRCKFPIRFVGKEIPYLCYVNTPVSGCIYFKERQKTMDKRTKEQALDKVLDFIKTNWTGEDNFILSDDRILKRIKVSTEECKNRMHLVTEEYYIDIPPKGTVVSGTLGDSGIIVVGFSKGRMTELGYLEVYNDYCDGVHTFFIKDWKVYKEVKDNE